MSRVRARKITCVTDSGTRVRGGSRAGLACTGRAPGAVAVIRQPRWFGGTARAVSERVDGDLSGVLRPVREGNAFEETVERLLTVIKLGLIGPGERFPPERELAAQLGISRLTLREAIRELQQARYVQSRRGRLGGTFITYTRPAPNVDDLRRLATERGQKLADALTFRFAVETGAADLLAQQIAAAAAASQPRAPRTLGPAVAALAAQANANGAAGAKREVLLARLADVNHAGPREYRRMDTLFHLSIAELTGSNLLASACTEARMLLNDLLNAIPVLRLNIAHAATQHAAIVDAILAGDPEGARNAVAEHLSGTASLLRGFLG
jgi:DNA-binding FadR family transcriptional regulator